MSFLLHFMLSYMFLHITVDGRFRFPKFYLITLLIALPQLRTVIVLVIKFQMY